MMLHNDIITLSITTLELGHSANSFTVVLSPLTQVVIMFNVVILNVVAPSKQDIYGTLKF
jgi:hypothetical protein